MKVQIAAIRPIQTALIANALLPHVERVNVMSSAPRRYFRGMDERVGVRLVPSPAQVLHNLLPGGLAKPWHRWDVVVWDKLVAALLPEADSVITFATQGLQTMQAAKRLGARMVLDRACPHVDFQQQIVEGEAEKAGVKFAREPAWFRERQLAEYEAAHAIVVPSRYSARTFPAALQKKLVIAPLLPRELTRVGVAREQHKVFTVGVLGGNPLRKGYLYLLEAWKAMALPNARLLLRMSAGFDRYPRLAELVRQPGVELVRFLPHISDFYQLCDVFCLPSVDDGFGMALLEAMAHGLAVVTTTHTGASELLTEGIDGLIVPPFDAEALERALLRLYSDAEMRRAMSEAARRTVERVQQERLFERAYWSAVAPGGAM